jgi:TetR/AcrR family transcriptional repressor of nem operon
MPGRPLEFEPAVAIERAMHVFRESGFAATSVQEIVDATGVPRQSLYNTLGDKRTVYLSALDCHVTQESEWLGVLRTPDADLETLLTLLDGRVRELTVPGEPRLGTFAANAAAELAAHDEDVAALLQQHTRTTSASFARALRQGIERGQVRDDIDATAAARSLALMMHGISNASRAGATRRSLLEALGLAIDTLRP